MIKGEKIKDDTEWDEERFREEMYQYSLDQFEGVEGRYYGIMEELDNLKKLIELIGPTIVKEEAEFREIEKAEFDPDFSTLGEKVLAAWHKKTYRQFTYKALFMLIQSIFENGLKELYNTLLAERRLKAPLTNNKIIDVLNAFKKFDNSISGRMPEIHAFNFIRNKISHNEGYCSTTDTGFQEAKKFIVNRTDVRVTELLTPKESYTHKIQVLRSSLLVDYIDFVKTIFYSLLKVARNAAYFS